MTPGPYRTPEPPPPEERKPRGYPGPWGTSWGRWWDLVFSLLMVGFGVRLVVQGEYPILWPAYLGTSVGLLAWYGGRILRGR